MLANLYTALAMSQGTVVVTLHVFTPLIIQQPYEIAINISPFDR